MKRIKVLWSRSIVRLQHREEQVFLLLSLLIGALTGLAVVAFIVVTERLGMLYVLWNLSRDIRKGKQRSIKASRFYE